MQTILITGGTGMIATRMMQLLTARGYRVILLSRQPPRSSVHSLVSYAQWDVAAGTIDPAAIAAADHIIHLAGAGVADKRWSRKRKEEIVVSRTQSSAVLVKALRDHPNRVQSVVSMSAIGWYGPDTAESRRGGFTEEMPADSAFLGETCRVWEASIEPVTQLGKRLVKLRTGIVLSTAGGALQAFRNPLHAGVATILGNGRQVVSWIHVDDLCRMFLYAIEKDTMQGVYNAVAPHPVTHRVLMLALARAICGRFFLPVYVPAFALKIILGEMSIEVLKSATVSAEKILGTGFVFTYPSLDVALASLYAKK